MLRRKVSSIVPIRYDKIKKRKRKKVPVGHVCLVTFPESRETRRDKRKSGQSRNFQSYVSPEDFSPRIIFVRKQPRKSSPPQPAILYPRSMGKTRRDWSSIAGGVVSRTRVGSIEIATNDRVRSCPGESTTNPSSKIRTPFDEGQARLMPRNADRAVDYPCQGSPRPLTATLNHAYMWETITI